MPRVFVVGVTRGVGSRLAAHRVERGDQTIRLHRCPEQARALEARGVEVAAAAAAAAGLRRFLLVSAFPDAWRDRNMPPESERYVKVKRQADVHLGGGGLAGVPVPQGSAER